MLKFQPPGFGQKFIKTSLGNIVYYTQMSEPWQFDEVEKLPPLLFLHNFGGGASAFEWSKV
ncbi:MAG: alpha/beta hydrolase, partial [Sphaerospermopsis kisseleviana]